MADINIQQLISALKIRPALYNKDNCMYYSNKKFKCKLWGEVCREMNKNWDQCTPQEKIDYARELQKCWRNLRASFDRELDLRVKEKIESETSDEPAKKRRKYEHFNSLAFLVHPDKVKDYEVNKDRDSAPEPPEPQAQISVADQIDSTPHYSPPEPAVSQNYVREYVREVETRYPLEDQLVQLFRDFRKSEDDDDRQFLLSLGAMFRKMDAKKKVEARIEVLKLLQKMTYRFDDANNQYI